ncbi:hypothetical protein AB0299_05775 [Pseudarthrobacter sp. NPDC080037]
MDYGTADEVMGLRLEWVDGWQAPERTPRRRNPQVQLDGGAKDTAGR